MSWGGFIGVWITAIAMLGFYYFLEGRDRAGDGQKAEGAGKE